MSEKVSDVVSQLEVAIKAIEERTPHTDSSCESVTDGAIACDSCYCDRTERLRREIARVWLKERTAERDAGAKLCEIYFDIAANVLGETEVRKQFAARFEDVSGAAAFRATQEPKP